MWIRVLLDEELHRQVRHQALERHLSWREVVSEAVRLWLSQQSKLA